MGGQCLPQKTQLSENLSARHGILSYKLLVSQIPEALKVAKDIAIAFGCPPSWYDPITEDAIHCRETKLELTPKLYPC